MVPVYSFFSYLGMILKDETIYLNAVSYKSLLLQGGHDLLRIIRPDYLCACYSSATFQMRECYESYVIYNFMMFLVTYMYEHYNVEQLLTFKPAQPQLFPFQKLPPWPKVQSGDWCN